MKKNAVRRSRLWAVALAGTLAVALPGCGSNGPNGPQTVTDSRSVPAGSASFLTFTITRNGTVDVNVNWNDAANDIDIYATLGSCPDFNTLANGGCSILALSESGTAKPERITFGASSGQAYKIFAFNLGPNADTVTITATIH